MTPIPYSFIHAYLPEDPSKILDLSLHEYPLLAGEFQALRIYKAAFSHEQAMRCCESQLFEDIFCTDPVHLPFLDENFHLVLHAPGAQELLEHMDCLRESVRVLRPQGILVGWLSGELFPQDEKELAQLMARLGIELLEHTQNNYFIGRKMN